MKEREREERCFRCVKGVCVCCVGGGTLYRAVKRNPKLAIICILHMQAPQLGLIMKQLFPFLSQTFAEDVLSF